MRARCLRGATENGLTRVAAEYNELAPPGRKATRRGYLRPITYSLLQQKFPEQLAPLKGGFLVLEMFTLQNDFGLLNHDRSFIVPDIRVLKELTIKRLELGNYEPAEVKAAPGFKELDGYHRKNRLPTKEKTGKWFDSYV